MVVAFPPHCCSCCQFLWRPSKQAVLLEYGTENTTSHQSSMWMGAWSMATTKKSKYKMGKKIIWKHPKWMPKDLLGIGEYGCRYLLKCVSWKPPNGFQWYLLCANAATSLVLKRFRRLPVAMANSRHCWNFRRWWSRKHSEATTYIIRDHLFPSKSNVITNSFRNITNQSVPFHASVSLYFDRSRPGFVEPTFFQSRTTRKSTVL